jgi:coenzyme F420-reducing hydrogenase delta subunit
MVPCTGRVDILHLLRAFEDGTDGVFLSGCLIGDCHYISGNEKATRRIAYVKKTLQTIGIEPQRVEIYYNSSAMGPLFQLGGREMVSDAKLRSLEGYKLKKAAKRGFREWSRVFQTIDGLHEHTRWSDLPDWVILFLCENSPECRLTVYNLLMNVSGLGSGFEFEILPPEKLMPLMGSYFILVDQVRFECMRRLGWVESIPWESKSIIEQVFESFRVSSPFMLPVPKMTPRHPGYEKIRGTDDLDYVTFLRKHIPDAIRAFRKSQMQVKLKDEERATSERPGDRT